MDQVRINDTSKACEILHECNVDSPCQLTVGFTRINIGDGSTIDDRRRHCTHHRLLESGLVRYIQHIDSNPRVAMCKLSRRHAVNLLVCFIEQHGKKR